MKEKPRKRPSSTNLSHERGDGLHLGFGVTHQLLRLHGDTVEADQSLMASLGPKVIVVSSLWITLYSRYVRGSEQLVKSSS